MDKVIEYGRIYSEISNGYSRQLINNNYIYFKHPTLAQYFSNYTIYEDLIEEAEKKGVKTESDKIKEAIENGWWASEKESTISLLKRTCENLQKTRSKLILPSQQEQINKDIKKNTGILLTYTKERNEILGYTAEQYANNKLTERLLITFSYKDKKFKKSFFTDNSEYYDIEDSYLNKIKSAFDSHSLLFNNENIKKIAACGFFQNLVYLCDDPLCLWGLSAVNCTKFQSDLLLYGKMYRNLIKSYAENGKTVNQEILEDPDKFVSWAENQNSSTPSKSNNKLKGETAISSYVGATKEDLDKMGVKIEKVKGKSLLQLAEDMGGTLEKSDYLNAREGV